MGVSKLYPINWTHLFHNFLLFGHRFFIGIPINWTYFLFKTLFLGHTFACVSSIIGLHTEDSSSVKIQKPAKVDYNTMPAQQSVSAMQREIAYLRQQIEFLKKITELDNDRKPRT